MEPLGVVGADEGAEEGLEDRGAEGLGRRRAAAVEEGVERRVRGLALDEADVVEGADQRIGGAEDVRDPGLVGASCIILMARGGGS